MKTEFPYFMQITANKSTHEFKIGEIVKVTDQFAQYHTVRWFHAANKSGKVWAVSDLDLLITDKSF